MTQENGNSPLLLAAGLGYRGAIGGTETMALEAITFSLAQGADIDAVNAAGDSALHIAATTNFEESGTAAGSMAIVRFLVEHGAKLDTRNKQGRTALESVVRAREHSTGDRRVPPGPHTVRTVNRCAGPQRAEHGVGFHPDASRCFLNSYVLM